MTGSKLKIFVNIHNRQKKLQLSRLERDLMRRAARAAFENGAGGRLQKGFIGKGVEITIIITDDAGIKIANRDFLGKDRATDVLSFPLIDFNAGNDISRAEIIDPNTGLAPIGEILICAERARAQAAEYGHSYERELGFLAVHGVLHLLGYDHAEGESADMAEISERTLSGIGLSL